MSAVNVPSLRLSTALFCLIGSVIIDYTEEYSSGAPVEACEEMVPQHNNVTASISLSTYYIASNKLAFNPGDRLTVHIRSLSKEHSFKGFFVQARDADYHNIGSFLPVDEAKLVSCGAGTNNAATHINNQLKKKVSLTWISPNETINGPISFQLTLVKEYKKFWVGLKSEEIIVL